MNRLPHWNVTIKNVLHLTQTLFILYIYLQPTHGLHHYLSTPPPSSAAKLLHVKHPFVSNTSKTPQSLLAASMAWEYCPHKSKAFVVSFL